MQEFFSNIGLYFLMALVSLLTLCLLVWQDISESKEPYDKEKKKFNIKQHWWKYRWDNVIIKCLCGILGSIVSAEISIYIINKHLTFMPEIAQGSIDLLGVFASTYYFGTYISKKLGVKKS